MAAPNDAAVYASRPSFSVGGQPNPDLSAALLSLAIIEDVHGLYRCEAEFGNRGPVEGQNRFLYFDRQVLDFGTNLAVSVGQDRLFEGRIMALQGNFPQGGPPTLGVLAEDRLQDLRMVRRTRSFAQMSDADVFAQIARDHGLTPQVDLQGPSHPVLAQVNQSDLALLRERARCIDAEVWLEDMTLHAAPRRNRRSDGGSWVLNARLHEFSVIADLAGQRTAVVSSGWDVAAKAGLRHEATASVLGPELGSDESGASVLEAKLGARKEALVHGEPFTAGEAQTRAESLFRHMARRFVVGRGVAETDARLRVGRDVDLQGLGPLFSGKYYLAEVRHRFDGVAGLRTEFVAERAGIGRP